MSLNALSLPVHGTCGPRHRSTQSPCPYRLISSFGGNAGDDLGLVVLAHALERTATAVIARHHAAVDLLIRLGDLVHLRFDRRQILGREGPLEGEVVVEAVLDDRADRDLRLREELLHGLREQVRGRMADDLEPFRIAIRDDARPWRPRQ